MFYSKMAEDREKDQQAVIDESKKDREGMEKDPSGRKVER